MITVASFDIGKNNFAFCIERVCVDHLLCIKKAGNTKAIYLEDGTASPTTSELLQEVYMSGDIIEIKNNNITAEGFTSLRPDYVTATVFARKKISFDLGLCVCMSNVLDSYEHLWKDVDVFLVEKQMDINNLCVRLSQHCESYFLLKYPGKRVVEFPSHFKTTVLGAPKVLKKGGKTLKKKYKSMEKPARKKWAVDTAKEILAERGDFKTLKTLGPYTKAYDKCDCIVQLQAWKYLEFIM